MQSTRSSRTEGFYFIVVDGVPPYCQWQELKDYLRDSVKVSPGYANVLKINEDGTRVGFCPLRNKAEADKAFEYLVAEGWRGLNIRVSIVWKADLQSEEIERRRGPEQSRRKRASKRPNLPPFPNVQPSAQASTSYFDTYNFEIAALRPNASAFFGENTQRSTALYQDFAQNYVSFPKCTVNGQTLNTPPDDSTIQSKASATSPKLPPLHSGTLSSPQDMILTERYSIHISRLPHEIKVQDLRTILSQYGPVCDVTIRRSNDKRCSATARYQYSSDAALAIRQLDHKCFQKRNLVVRYDRSEGIGNASISSATSRTSNDSDSLNSRKSCKATQQGKGPLVVNGARGPSYGKSKEKHDDEEVVNKSSD